MPQARYLLVRGVPGHLLANPHVPAESRRFLGKEPHGPFWEEGPPGDDGKPQWPASVPVEEVVLDEASIRKAAHKSRGGIEILKECVAWNHDDARKKLQPAPAAPAKKLQPAGEK